MTVNFQWLVERYRREIARLEALIEETRHKQHVLEEASRLLVQEALTHSRTLYEKLTEADRERNS